MLNVQTTKDEIATMYPYISINCGNPKKTFDEIALSRCSVMAHESLNPEEFEAFTKVHNILIKRRRLQNSNII